MVKKLVRLLPCLAASHTLNRDRPGVFNPATDVDVVNQPIDNEAAVQPGEATIIGDLVGQLTHIALVTYADRPVHPVCVFRDNRSDEPVVDLVDGFFER